MRGAIVLPLLLCLYWTWAQGETAEESRKEDVQFEIEGVSKAHDHSSRQTSATPDVLAELKELRDMVIKQKMELRNAQTKIAALEQDNTATLDVVTALKASMSTNENQVKELKMTAGAKVAFSLGLSNMGGFGPFIVETTLKFGKIFYNFGEAYNSATGVFTAPVRGAYYFRFTTWEYFTSSQMAVSLYHNRQRVMYNYDMNDENFVNMSNALILQLEKGDTVHMTLPAGYSVYDDRNNLVTFSGFLLFPL